MIESKKAIAILSYGHFTFSHTRNRANINQTNKNPWILPVILTAIGIFPIYLSGIATPNKSRYDMPSILPIFLKDFIGSLRFDFMQIT